MNWLEKRSLPCIWERERSYYMGRASAQAGDYPMAAELYVQSLGESCPYSNVATAHDTISLHLGYAYMEMGEVQEAIAVLQAIKNVSVVSYAQVAIGQLLGQQNNSVGAAAELMRITGEKPNDPKVALELARRLYEAGEFSTAIDALEAHVARGVQIAGIYSVLGRSYLALLNPVQALDVYLRCVETIPEASECWTNAGATALSLGLAGCRREILSGRRLQFESYAKRFLAI